MGGAAATQRQGQDEGRAAAGLALAVQAAAHHLGQLPTDGQAQARAAEPAGDGAVRLLEAA